MSSIKNKTLAVVVSVTTLLWLSGVGVFVPVARAQSNSATIQQLLAQIALLQTQLLALQGGSSTGGAFSSCSFTRDLTVGSKGADVTCLQQGLITTGHYTYSGGATGYFGNVTKAALAAWQAANGVSPASGYFGPITRAKIASLAAAPPPPPPAGPPPVGPAGPPPPVAVGSGLTVSAGSQPAAGQLHPDNAVRVPYTTVVFTASFDGDITVNSVTAERQGPSVDSTFSGVVLLDEKGTQVGLEKTLNSAHQAVLSEPFVVKAGTSRTMTVAANRTTGGSNGTQAWFAVTSVSTNAAVSGTLPITGASRTMNVSGLTIGTVTVETGPSKSVATTTEDAGKTMIFTAVRVTAGSAEDISMQSMRFNQVGTIGSGDITNVEVKVDGVVYPNTISTDGKYYTAVFGNGIVITKGNNKEVTIGGMLSGGTNRTIQFHVYRMTDIAVNGQLYGYGINPTASTGFTTTNPVYWASQVTVGKATLLVEKDATVIAQNVAVNLSDQPLSGFTVDVRGEPISVASLVFNIAPNNGAGQVSAESGSDITQIKLIGPNKQIVAGPVDGVAAGTVTFTDTVTFPVGKNGYKLVGKLGTNFDSSDTVSASTTPSSNWTTVRGVTTGETITPTPSSSVTGNIMTVKAASLTISVAPTPVAQSVVSGIQKFTFATYQLDAQQSGEDVRMSTIPLEFEVGGTGSASNLTSCQLYDGSTSLTSGSNVLNPSAAASSTSLTFDGSGFVIPKGTIKNIDMKCNIAGGATGFYLWGYDVSSSPSATGLTSGQSITPTENDSPGQRMTLLSGGSYTVTDNSTPGYHILNPGSTGNTLLQLRFAAFNEDVDIQRVNFQLTGVASNTPVDLVNNQVTLYDAANPTVALATAQFSNSGDYATSSLIASGAFRVPQGSYKDMLVKGDIAAITVSGPLVRSGDLLIVDYDGTANGISNGNYGSGVSSGTNLSPTSADTAIGGVRILKAYPSFAKMSVPSNLLTTNSTYVLYRFSAQAVNGDVHLAKLTFNVSSTTISGNNNGVHATTSQYSLYAYTDSSFSIADTTAPGNGSGAGLVNGGQCYNGSDGNTGSANSVGVAGGSDIEIFPTSACSTGTTTYKIAGGVTRYFELRANVASVETSSGVDTIQVVLRGDNAFPTSHQNSGVGGGVSTNYVGDMGQSGAATTTLWESGKQGGGSHAGSRYGVDGDTNNDLIWTPASTSSSPSIFDFDFTNGYQVPGLPATDMSQETHTSSN